MGHVEKANEVLAIETLLVSDELFRSVEMSIFLFLKKIGKEYC